MNKSTIYPYRITIHTVKQRTCTEQRGGARGEAGGAGILGLIALRSYSKRRGTRFT
jgi:hypothetical protein